MTLPITLFAGGATLYSLFEGCYTLKLAPRVDSATIRVFLCVVAVSTMVFAATMGVGTLCRMWIAGAVVRWVTIVVLDLLIVGCGRSAFEAMKPSMS